MRQEVRVANAVWADEVQVMVFSADERGNRWRAAPLTMVEHKPGDYIVEPTFRLRREDAQRLMDELWNCGLRPSEGSGSAGSLKATQEHLADMRKIAFDLLQVE